MRNYKIVKNPIYVYKYGSYWPTVLQMTRPSRREFTRYIQSPWIFITMPEGATMIFPILRLSL